MYTVKVSVKVPCPAWFLEIEKNSQNCSKNQNLSPRETKKNFSIKIKYLFEKI